MSNLNRVHFQVSRSAEYFDVKELQAQTGQPVSNFGDVVLKELIDNALDACESAGIDPVINIGFAATETRIRLCVADNGSGMSRDVVSSILNFETRTSDKAAYKSPTRGAQGNAFKTIIGIPHALGGGLVIIESQGLRHEITAAATPAGTIDINHEAIVIPHVTGTAVYVDMPRCEAKPVWYARATAMFNPHAFVKFCRFDDIEFSVLDFEKETDRGFVFYKKLSGLQKIRPNEPTSAHWYNPDDFHKLVYLQGAQRDIPLGNFVRQFKGLSSTGKAGKVTRAIPFKRVSDVGDNCAACKSLLIAMQSESKPVPPKALGAVGEANMLARLDVDRHWYKQASGTVDNVPYVFEILIAESGTPGFFYFGINHSVAFDDYLSRCLIKAGDIHGRGVKGALADIVDSHNHIVVVHLIGIGLPFLDRGKSSLSLPGEMLENISGAVWSAAKVLFKEYKARQKDVARSFRAAEARQKENTKSIKASVFHVLPDAIQAATDNERLPANVRGLFYKVREAIKKYTSKDLNYTYFGQTLLIQYWQKNGRHPMIYSDPRGVFYEPHSGEILHLGTFSVDHYSFPLHQYNKILYVEKKRFGTR